jgi:hypothetical protein
MIGFLVRVFAVLLVLAALAAGLILLRAEPVVIAFKERPLDSLETAEMIRHPQTRQSVFGRLERTGDVDYFTFTLARGTPFRVSIKTPVADRDFNPVLTLFGPGLPQPTQDPSIPIGDANGAIVERVAGGSRTAVFDFPRLTTFYVGPKIDMTAPQDGTFALAVTTPDGNDGRYVLDIGGKSERTVDNTVSFLSGTVRAILRLY